MAYDVLFGVRNFLHMVSRSEFLVSLSRRRASRLSTLDGTFVSCL
jgi:hypothetical protein